MFIKEKECKNSNIVVNPIIFPISPLTGNFIAHILRTWAYPGIRFRNIKVQLQRVCSSKYIHGLELKSTKGSQNVAMI